MGTRQSSRPVSGVAELPGRGGITSCSGQGSMSRGGSGVSLGDRVRRGMGPFHKRHSLRAGKVTRGVDLRTAGHKPESNPEREGGLAGHWAGFRGP